MGQYHWRRWVSFCPSDFMYVYVCDQVCVGTCCPPLLLCLIFQNRVSHWTWRPVVFLDWLANKSQRCLSSLAPQLLDYRYTPPHPASFMWVLGFELNSLCLHEKHFAHWTIFPETSIVIFFLKIIFFGKYNLLHTKEWRLWVSVCFIKKETATDNFNKWSCAFSRKYFLLLFLLLTAHFLVYDCKLDDIQIVCFAISSLHCTGSLAHPECSQTYLENFGDVFFFSFKCDKSSFTAQSLWPFLTMWL